MAVLTDNAAFMQFVVLTYEQKCRSIRPRRCSFLTTNRQHQLYSTAWYLPRHEIFVESTRKSQRSVAEAVSMSSCAVLLFYGGRWGFFLCRTLDRTNFTYERVFFWGGALINEPFNIKTTQHVMTGIHEWWIGKDLEGRPVAYIP
jgi:hypothetical protein